MVPQTRTYQTSLRTTYNTVHTTRVVQVYVSTTRIWEVGRFRDEPLQNKPWAWTLVVQTGTLLVSVMSCGLETILTPSGIR